MKASLWLIPLAMVLSGAAHAAQGGFVVTDTNSFDAAASQLHAQLSSGSYPLLSASEKQAIEADLLQMQQLLTRYGSPQSLNRSNGVRYFNAQEHLNGLLFADLAQRQNCEFFRVDNLVRCASYDEKFGRRMAAVRTEQPVVNGTPPNQVSAFGNTSLRRK